MKIKTKLIIILSVLFFLCVSPAVLLYYRVQVFYKIVNQVPSAINNMAKTAELNSVSQFIRYYDEVLTQSARNYVFTGDLSWKDRYNNVAPLLDDKIKEAVANGTVEEKEFFESIDAANQTLVMMEQKSMKLMDQGKETEAQTILNSLAYARQKEIYRKGMEAYAVGRGRKYSDALTVSTQSVDRSINAFQKNLNIDLWIIFLILFFCVFSGFIIYSFVRVSIIKRLGEFSKATEEIARGNLSYEIVNDENDEIGRLAEAFRVMVRAVKSSRVEIEEKVKSQTIELKNTLKSAETRNLDLKNTKVAILNVMEDLSKEKKKISEEKNRMETILSSIGDGVFVTDVEGRVTRVNQSAEKMSGYSDVEIYGKKYTKAFKFVSEDDLEGEYPDFVMEAIKTGKVGSMLPHTVLISKDGSKIPVLDSAAPLRSFDGIVFGCVVVIRDNTQERELEKSKDDFLSVASHQLRTPLGSMRWNLEMLLEGDSGELNKEMGELIEQVHQGNLRMIGLVNDLLDVSRIDQGRVMDEPEETDLRKVMEEILVEMEPLIKQRKIKVVSKIEDNIDNLLIDKKRFREVIENLVSNAVKYNKDGGEVNISMKRVEKNIEIAITDNGMGIPKKDQERLFTKFFRAENAVHSETEGSGLGLYVVKKFVEGWGGKLTVESEIGKGSKFVVYLPADKNNKSLNQSS